MTGLPSDRFVTLPDRSLEQRMDALRRANVVRCWRARLKVDLKAGRVQFLDLLADPPERLLSCKVYALLLAVPKVGRVKAQRALLDAGVSPSKTFGGLTQRQRGELARMLAYRCGAFR